MKRKGGLETRDSRRERGQEGWTAGSIDESMLDQTPAQLAQLNKDQQDLF